MTKLKTLFALTLAALMLTLAVPAPRALACGGYGSFDPDERAVRRAVAAHVAAREELDPHYVERIEIRGDEAEALVVVVTDGGSTGRRTVQLARTGDGWRVVRWRAGRA